jgi:hypothetical protein
MAIVMQHVRGFMEDRKIWIGNKEEKAIFMDELKKWDNSLTEHSCVKRSILDFLFRNTVERVARRREVDIPLYWTLKVERQTIYANPSRYPSYHERTIKIEVTGKVKYSKESHTRGIYTVRERKRNGRFGTLSIGVDEYAIDTLLLGSAKYEVHEWKLDSEEIERVFGQIQPVADKAVAKNYHQVAKLKQNQAQAEVRVLLQDLIDENLGKEQILISMDRLKEMRDLLS